jgi:preprotein translocase subunit SecF
VSPGRIRPGAASSDGPDKAKPEVIDAVTEDSAATIDADININTDIDTETAASPVEAPPSIGTPEVEVPTPVTVPVSPIDLDRDLADLTSDESEILAPPIVAPEARAHGAFRRLYYGETTFDFVRRKRIWFTISTVVILLGVISLGFRGLNMSIEFVGGTSWTVSSPTLTVLQTTSAMTAAGLTGETVVSLGQGTNRSIEVQSKLPKGQSASAQTSESNKIATALQKAAHKSSINDVSVETVGPSWGGQITQKAVIALIVFFILVSLYISLFFEWRMALAAILAVLHDILVTVGIYSISGFLVTPDTVVAFLTILGYSLYDTIVVFDRVRDNVKNLSVRDRLTFSDIVNLSMNQTAARSINTSLVAIMPILSVLLIGAELLGATTLQYFGLALLVGLTTGAYSSIFIASPLVAVMKERQPKYVELRKRIELRGPSAWLLSPSEVARGFSADSPIRTRSTIVASKATGRVRPGTAASATPSVNGASSGTTTSSGDAPLPRMPPQVAKRAPSKARRRGGRR